MKTIKFELSKRLNELWFLDNINPLWIYAKLENWYTPINEYSYMEELDYKTLTIEEAIEFLPKEIDKHFLNFWPLFDIWYVQYQHWLWYINHWVKWTTLLEAVENMIEYLLDNNLLWNK